MADVSPTGISMETVLAITGAQLVAAVNGVKNEGARQIAQRDQEIAELREQIAQHERTISALLNGPEGQADDVDEPSSTENADADEPDQ